MSKKKSVIGFCRLCGLKKKLTFEHIPPKKAFNTNPIFIQRAEHLLEPKGHLFGKRSKENKGFGSYTLCESCNNNTGNWYAKDFIEFSTQGMAIQNSKTRTNNIFSFNFRLKPLNVVKQIITMFLSTDVTKTILNHPNLKDFILDKQSIDFPSKIRIFMYSTLSPDKKMIGPGVGTSRSFEGISTLSEISFQPFGFIMAFGDVHPKIPFFEITHFLRYHYDEVVEMTAASPYLEIIPQIPVVGYFKS